MQILDIKGKKWMVGLEWEILPGDSTIKLEAKEVAEKTNSKFGVVVEYDSTYAIGLTKKLVKEPSAALYLALANQDFRENGNPGDYPDWIVLEEVSDDKYWMAVIKSGIPAPQFDAVLSITDIKDRITELLINDTYTVYTSAGEIIAIFDGIKTIHNRTLNDITADVKTKIKFQKLLGIPNSVIYTGVGLMVGCILIYGGLQFFEGRSIQEKARLLATKQEREKAAKEKQYRDELQNYEAKKKELSEKEYDKLISNLSGNPSQILTAFYEQVGNSSLGTHGWTLSKIDCYYEINPQVTPTTPEANATNSQAPLPVLACDYLYQRNSLSTTRMLLEDFPDAKLNGDNAVVTRKVEIDPKYVAKADNTILSTIKPSRDWGFNVQSQLQLLKIANIEHDIKASTEISYKVPGKPLSPNEIASGMKPKGEESVNLGVGMGELAIKSKTFDFVKELADNVDFTATGLKKVTFTVEKGGDISWVALFNYYVKTTDGQIGTSSSNGVVDAAKDAAPNGQPMGQPMTVK